MFIDMKGRFTVPAVLVLIALSLTSTKCDNYCKYPVTVQPSTKDFPYLTGIWKTEEDSVKENFFLVQAYTDITEATGGRATGPDNVDSLYWNRVFYLTYFSAKGQNPLYQLQPILISDLDSNYFINIPYRYHATGYIFCRLIEVKEDRLLVAMIADETMKWLSTADQLRERIRKNIDNKEFYKDTLHLYKVKSGFFSIEEAIEAAN